MRRSLRTAPSLLLAVALGLTLSACGDKETSTASDPDAAAPPSKPAHTLTQADFTRRVFGAIEKSGSAKIHFAAGSGAQKSSGDGEAKFGDEVALELTMGSPANGAKEEKVLLIGDTFYIGMGGKYMTMSLDSMKGSGMPDISTNFDPKVQAKTFEKATVGFEQQGAAETLDGVKALPYEVTIDPKKAPEAFGTTLTAPMSFTYYVGPDDLPRKMIYHNEQGEFVATYSDWGAPVDIQKPPASELAGSM